MRVLKFNCKKGQENLLYSIRHLEIFKMINGHTPREIAHGKTYYCNITVFSLVKEEQHHTMKLTVEYPQAFPVSAF